MCDQQSLRSACAYAQSDQSLCYSLKHSKTIKLLTEQHLEFLSFKGGGTGSSESTLCQNATFLEIVCGGSYEMLHALCFLDCLTPLSLSCSTHISHMHFQSLSFGRNHFEFKGCWVVNFNFIQILKVHFVSKGCKTCVLQRLI